LGRTKRSTPGFRRITMEEQTAKIESLLNNDEYNGPIIEFLSTYPEAKFGIIVSMISCFEMTVEHTKLEEREGGGNATLPGEAVGAPPGFGDITLEAKAGGNTTVENSGTYKDEVIVACGYVELSLKKRHSGFKFWKSRKPSPHDITFTPEAIHPLTMTVSAPPARIEGDQEAVLGEITEGESEAAPIARIPELSSQDDDKSDFVLYA